MDRFNSSVSRFVYCILCTVLCLCLFVPENKVSAKTTGNFYGYYVVQEVLDDVEMVDTSVSGSNNVYTYRWYSHYEYTIVTNDPTCSGAVNLTNVGSVSYTGTYTHGSSGSHTGTFSDTNPTVTSASASQITLYRGTGAISSTSTVMEINQLDPDQLASIITAISNIDIDAYDDTQLLQYLSDIETVLNTLNTDLLNINWQLDSNNAYSMAYNLSQSLQSLNTYVLYINNTVNATYTYLTTVIQPILSNISQAIGVTNTRLLTINSTIADGFNHLESNIDSLLDSISWETNSYTANLYSDLGSTLVSSISPGNRYYLDITEIIGTYNNTYTRLFMVHAPLNFSLPGNAGRSYLEQFRIEYYNVISDLDVYYYKNRSNFNGCTFYFTLAPNYYFSNNTYRCFLSFVYSGNIYGSFTNGNSDFYKFILDSDIEYWQLLDSITLQNWFNLYKEDNTSTSQNIINATQSLTTANNQLVSFEDQFTDDMNSSLQDINLNLDLESGLTDFNDTLSYFTTVNNALMDIPLIRYSILLILIFALIGLIL